MLVLANLLIAAGQALGLALDIYMWVIIIRALLSWVNPDPFNPMVRLLGRLTDPVLDPIRRLVPTKSLGLDLSPLIAVLAIVFAKQFLAASLVEYGYRLKLH
jgi:YggT family protein